MAEPLYRPSKQARGRWGNAEMNTLIEVWKPIYFRRHQGEVDGVQPRWQRHLCSSRSLVANDRHVVAATVNASCDRNTKTRGYHHSWEQCKDRMAALDKIYKEFLSAQPSPWHFFTALDDVLRPAAGEPIGVPPAAPVEPEHAAAQEAC